MKLIIGLGNPGKQYEKTRHNLGFTVVDEFLKKMDGGKWKIGVEDGRWKMESKFKSELLRVDDLILIKPQTYMNNSGQAIKLLTTYYQLLTTNLIVIHDDLDLMLGKIKVRMGGAAGGHHGVESIINALDSDQFIRVRLGIGNERSYSGEHKRIAFNAEHFVLESFMPGEYSKVKHMIKQALEGLELLLDKGLEVVQRDYN